MNNKRSIYLPIVLSLVLILGILIGYAIRKQPRQESLFMLPKSDKFNNVMQYIKHEYVDEVDENKLTEEAITGMLKKLDPHSVYIPSTEVQAMNEPLEGGFGGVGIQFNMIRDTVVIINTIPNSPSARLGLLPGDRIVKVDDSIVAGVKLGSDAIVKKLKGPRSTKVKVSILRPGQTKEISYTITRDRIPLNSVDVAYMISKTTGFIKISQFSKTTNDEFTRAVKMLHKKGMKKVLIDLRGNGGGILETAIQLADHFLPTNKLIVYTEGRTKPRSNSYATGHGLCEPDPVIVLVDEFSASASEILAGAIQDNDRGLIIGRRTFGKGLVQEQSVFQDGSAIRLTIARYYTPTGRCIQKPYVNGVDDYYMDLSKRFEHGELESKDSIHYADTNKYVTTSGKILYGGGGIMPDIFVPIDTMGISKFYLSVRDLGLVYRFAFDYSDNHRKKLKTFKTWKALDTYLQQQKIFNVFLKYADKNQVKANRSEIKQSGKVLSIQLRAYIARNFFDNEGFYPIIQDVDNMVLEGRKIFAE